MPRGRDKIDWKLIFDLPVISRRDALEKIRWYSQRWKIETFHKILKSGCRAEASKPVLPNDWSTSLHPVHTGLAHLLADDDQSFAAKHFAGPGLYHPRASPTRPVSLGATETLNSHALAVRTVNEEQSFVAIPNPTIGPVATMKLCAALALASLSTALAQNPAQTLGENPARPTVGQDATLTSRSTTDNCGDRNVRNCPLF